MGNELYRHCLRDENKMTKFKDLGLKEEVVRGVTDQGFEEAFELSNDVLLQGVQSVTDLMVRPGLVNLDYADVETIMSSMGKAMMGTGEAEGEGRALKAAEQAMTNPLIDDYSLKSAKGLLINITALNQLNLV